jgi:hypothetical protein
MLYILYINHIHILVKLYILINSNQGLDGIVAFEGIKSTDMCKDI